MLKAGLYDDLLSLHLRDEIERLRIEGIVSLLGKIEAAQLPDYLTRFLAAWLRVSPDMEKNRNFKTSYFSTLNPT